MIKGAPLRGLLPLALGLVLWQLLAPANSPYFPPPSEWIRALEALAQRRQLWPAISVTVMNFLLALLLSILIGSALGILLGRSKLLDRLLGPLLEFCRTMPAGALVPVAVLIMGYTSPMTLFVVVFTSFWPILLNARSGARNISQDRLDTARALKLKDRGLLRQGYRADLTIFDPGDFCDRATYTEPHQYPSGARTTVLVNGTIVVENAAHTDALPGSVLRRDQTGAVG